MIGAQLERCEIRHVQGTCAAAEQLADASVKAFPHLADWTPAADMIYLRFMLDLYERDGNATWYDLVRDNAEHALRKARSSDGLFFRGWDGRPLPDAAASARRRNACAVRVAGRRQALSDPLTGSQRSPR